MASSWLRSKRDRSLATPNAQSRCDLETSKITPPLILSRRPDYFFGEAAGLAVAALLRSHSDWQRPRRQGWRLAAPDSPPTKGRSGGSRSQTQVIRIGQHVIGQVVHDLAS